LSQRSGRLPGDVTSFVGRRQATAEVKRALSESRLVTLTGASGVGKTRLALHVAGELRRAFADGVWLVELGELDQASLVGSVVAAALGLPTSVREPAEVLTAHLEHKRLLLVLDNCEHLLDACADLLGRLLLAAPRLRVLATSREPLGMGGEQVWPVPTLSVPGLDAGTAGGPAYRYEALRLFQDRASAVRPGFTLGRDNAAAVAQVCRRLDGLPLAIELAAVWVRALSVEQILARLHDRFELLTAGARLAPARHQTLRAAVEWSFDLCTELERKLWARFSVFAGEFDLGRRGRVRGRRPGGRGRVHRRGGSGGQVDPDPGGDESRARYRMLETIRHYGAERLTESDAGAGVRRRHRDYYLGLVERAESDSLGPRQAEWNARLRAEQADLWAALAYCLSEPAEATMALRMCGALWFHWACGFISDGRYWLDRALAADTEPGRERVRALWVNGWLAQVQGDRSVALSLLEESRDLAQRLGEEIELTYAMQFLGEAEMSVDNMSVAVPMLDEAIARHRALDAWTAPALRLLGLRARAALRLGRIDDAVALCTEWEAICTSLDERWMLSWSQLNRAIICCAVGDQGTASDLVRSALRTKHDLGDRQGVPRCVDLLAWVAVLDGDAQRAAVLFGAADRGRKLIGVPFRWGWYLERMQEENIARSRESLGRRAFEAAREHGATMAQEEVIAYALGEDTGRAAPPESVPDQALTKREREVAAMVARGMSNKEIAAGLVIAQRTAERHVENILCKLGFTSRTQIAVWVAERA
jgi:predicted ATPase/DNA-binding CsgD family transcriptional regulator